MAKSSKKKNWKKEELKPSDKTGFVANANKTDIVIPVMGGTGVGKSTFINILIGKNVAKVGHDLRSETAVVQHYIVAHPDYPGQRLILVDTPGFDDTVRDDREVLRRIAIWLAQSYDASMTLAGLLYLHEISQMRVAGTARKNFDVFHKLCGPIAAKNVILVTTKWCDVTPEIGQHREKQLREAYWNDMIQQGSRMCRFEHTENSAWNIVNQILATPALTATLIQEELVVIDEYLEKTEAGRTLRLTLKELLEIQKKTATKLRNESDLRKLRENEQELKKTVTQIELLNVPISKRFMRWWGWFAIEASAAEFVAPTPMPIYTELEATDLIIPIMGTTGAGKSTLVNKLTGGDNAVIGDDIDNATSEIRHYIVPYPKRPDCRVIVVDTPGFILDDGDFAIVQRIVDWLKAQSGGHVSRNLAGVIYLHEIIQTRLTSAEQAVHHLKRFYSLCNIERGKNVVFVTTKWDLLPLREVEAGNREQQLNEHWKNVDGKKMWRLDEKFPATKVIDLILGSKSSRD